MTEKGESAIILMLNIYQQYRIFMITTIRIDDDLKRESESVFQDIGLNMTNAVTIFLRQVVKQRGIPFALISDPLPKRNSYIDVERQDLLERGKRVESFFQRSREKCDRDWSLDEINALIHEARAERKARGRV